VESSCAGFTLDQKIDGAGACTCMHCGEAQGDWKPAARACCSSVQSSVDEFRLLDFGQLNWEAPMGSDLVYSILSPEWNADDRVADKVYWTAVARLFRGIDLCRSEIYGGGWIWSRGFQSTYQR
jgi:hypothetical protein